MRSSGWILVGLATAAGAVSALQAETDAMLERERTVELQATAVTEVFNAADHQRRAQAALSFATATVRGETEQLLAFREAFNVATELSLPEGLRVANATPAIERLAESSVYYDPTLQANLRAMVAADDRIIGGVETTSHDECVAVGSATSWCCTGTLIAPDRVLTAGHCKDSCASRIFVGKDITGAGEEIPVREARRHPDYRTATRNDLTVLVLERPVTRARPVQVATDAAIRAARTVRLVGYGTTNAMGTTGYGKRRVVDVPVASHDCEPAEVGFKYGCDPGLEMVAASPLLDRDSCRGDSGGPVYVEVAGRWLLAGATSRATKGAAQPCGEGGIYVRVDRYSTWMMQ